VHGRARQPLSAVDGDAFGGGLLQRLVGEQPARRVRELRRRPAAQQCRFDKNSGAFAERCSRRSDIGHQGGVGESVFCELVERTLPRVAAQIGDVAEPELYDGLTPVIITL
jgi:hypothetical protein